MLKKQKMMMNPEVVIPVLGIITGIIVPVSVFIWLYFEGKDKNKTIEFNQLNVFCL